MFYRPEVDGLRAVAVIPVILFHAGLPLFSGGFVGVDVFFVISGYLITSIILAEIARNDFSLIRFYERRARRILPALFAVMLVSVICSWFILLPSDMLDFSQSLIAVSIFSSNILFFLETSYWDTASELKPLLHTWSLAVEEQYYLIFPIFLMLAYGFGKRWLLSILVIISIVSLCIAHFGSQSYPDAAFYLLPTRFWELALGAFLAFIPTNYDQHQERVSNVRKWLTELLGLLGLILIIYSCVAFDDHTPFPSLYTLVPTIGALLIIAFASANTIVGRLLSLKLFVGIGLISYSLYLWHQPVLAFARHVSFPEPDPLTLCVLILVIFILSILSWQFIEKPFRDKTLFNQKAIFTFALLGSFIFILIGSTGYLAEGYKDRKNYKRLLIASYEPDNRILQKQSWQPLRSLSSTKNYGVGNNQYDRTLWFDELDHRRKLLVVGNSHSKDIFNVLNQSRQASERFQIARYGYTPSTFEKDISDLFEAPNYLQSDIVIVASRYTEKDSYALEALTSRMLAEGKTVALVKNIFEFYYFANKTLADQLLQKQLITKIEDASISMQEVVEIIDNKSYQDFSSGIRSENALLSDRIIETIANKYSEVIILDRMNYVCELNVQRCFSISNKLEKYFYDYGHHTLEGAVFFGKRLDQTDWLQPLY